MMDFYSIACAQGPLLKAHADISSGARGLINGLWSDPSSCMREEKADAITLKSTFACPLHSYDTVCALDLQRYANRIHIA